MNFEPRARELGPTPEELPELDALEARVLGVLIEKELSTPEQYPLSLNALCAGANQRSNRQPVTAHGEGDLRSALERLRLQQLAGIAHASGGRVERWRHNARETLGLSALQSALLAELLLRGAQTQGELRAHVERLLPLPALELLASALEPLERRGLVRRLPPPPGGRAELLQQCLAPETQASAVALSNAADPVAAPGPGLASRVAALESQVNELRTAFEALKRSLGA